jgi:hypothetical protein
MTADETPTPDNEKKLLGVPYDTRRPTAARAKSRLWNGDDARVFTPKSFGWGYDVNFYWLAHPDAYAKRRRSAK